MKLRTFSRNDVAGRNVLVRVDFNVPLAPEGGVADDTRIRAHLPLIRELVEAGAKTCLCSHLGRPKGSVDVKYTLRPVAEELQRLLGRPVRFVGDCVGEPVENAVAAASGGDVLVLENLRFYAEEEKNDAAFAEKLAAPFDVFVMDAFSAAHRAHASTRGVTEFLPSFAGPLLIREIAALSAVRDHPKRPFVLILGGAKVSDKIGVIENMLDRTDAIVIGGGMAFTFFKAQGLEIGKSLCEEGKLAFASEMLALAKEKGVRILLPEDVVVAAAIAPDAVAQTVAADAVPGDLMGLDIGVRTVENIRVLLDTADTVLWNGPMGVFETAPFAEGTRAVADMLAKITAQGAFTVVGGGDTAAAVTKFGRQDEVSHVSTGGGASLEFFEGRMLPGVEPYIL